MMRSRLRIRLHHHRTRPQFLCARSRMRDCRCPRHPGRLRRVHVQFAPMHDFDTVFLPVHVDPSVWDEFVLRADSATYNNATLVSLGLTPGNVQGDLGHRSRSKFHDRRRSGPAARRPFTLRHRPRCIRSTRLAQEAEGSHGRCLIRRRTKIGFHPARAVPCSRIFHKSAGMYIERNIGPLQPHVGTSLRWSTLKGRFTRLD